MNTNQTEKGSLLQRLSDLLSRVVQYSCIFAMGTMTLVVLLGVIFRYIFLSPLSWSEELSRYLMIWGASLAITIGIRENEHVGLTVLIDQTGSKVIRIILNTIIFAVTAAFYSVMIYFSIKMTIEAKWQYTQGLGISMVLPSLAIPVAMTTALMQLIISYISSPDPGTHGQDIHVIDI